MDGRDAPEVVMHSDLEPYSDETANKSGMLFDYRQDQVMMVQQPPPPKKILGLRRSTFWLLVVLAVVVVAAAVGGGVGGSMAVANARK